MNYAISIILCFIGFIFFILASISLSADKEKMGILSANISLLFLTSAFVMNNISIFKKNRDNTKKWNPLFYKKGIAKNYILLFFWFNDKLTYYT